ncbi:response regulator transcription factor [Flavobacterium psychrophilum]|uniref:Two-component system response regulatory protein, LytTR family n=2 Tax=Flavobacterium psychrophilum TaxID=96345 RepID=A6GYE2_FLAPJ|nr:LytTR family DNA-binding domain-containing protein [Flavobacterium psychrophilum]AIG29831.1 LytR family transcriptional regulator [Flavobacterium psychrophilum]AIG32108.1 LytR family transcriptional regulator [Flavobacterium psychrophilum]AIG34263.1 LytR family transcriptional regulator [Flavobacterium psychrophilum]AIG36626.1 LytR family transcriptional regulator [Flavobacterium psychrophilum]AIG38891.1 LytR family transcriptional regulator [Flavobacterium psychrophilum]
MNCIIIDDEEMARAIINQMIANHNTLNLVQEFSNAIQAIKYLNQNNIDLIFLDIHMPDFTGFDFMQTIKNPPKIILITSDKNFAIEAFEYECVVDYLVKPITKERFEKAIAKALAKTNAAQISNRNSTIEIKSLTEDNNKEFYVNIDRRLIKIEFDLVTIVQAKGDYIHIKTEGKNYVVHSTLKKIEQKLPKDTFLKVHRSYIINTKKIIDIEDNSVLIAKDVIPVSRANRPELMKFLNLL